MVRVVRTALAVVVLGLWLVTTSPASWSPPRVLSPHSAPRAMTDVAGQGLVLWASGPRSERFTWPPGAAEPLRTLLPAFPIDLEATQWAANARGDVVAIGDAVSTVDALAIDATGTQAGFAERPPRPQSVGEAKAAIGADGTAVVAWTQLRRDDEELPFVWLRIRPPGGEFAPAIAIRGVGPVSELAVAVRPDGVAELVHVDWSGTEHAIVYHELQAGHPASAPTTIASTQAGSPFFLSLIPGGVGVSRLVFEDGDMNERVVAALRTPDGAWTRQSVGRGAYEAESVAVLADGSVVLAYPRAQRILVRRAISGQPFGPPQHVATIPRRWDSYATSLSASVEGRVLLAWIEYSAESDDVGYACENVGCFERVMVAAAEPGAPFGAPRRLSSLGSMPGDVVLFRHRHRRRARRDLAREFRKRLFLGLARGSQRRCQRPRSAGRTHRRPRASRRGDASRAPGSRRHPRPPAARTDPLRRALRRSARSVLAGPAVRSGHVGAARGGPSPWGNQNRELAAVSESPAEAAKARTPRWPRRIRVRDRRCRQPSLAPRPADRSPQRPEITAERSSRASACRAVQHSRGAGQRLPICMGSSSRGRIRLTVTSRRKQEQRRSAFRPLAPSSSAGVPGCRASASV